MYIIAKLEKDMKALANVTFDDLPTEDQWLELYPEIET